MGQFSKTGCGENYKPTCPKHGLVNTRVRFGTPRSVARFPSLGASGALRRRNGPVYMLCLLGRRFARLEFSGDIASAAGCRKAAPHERARAQGVWRGSSPEERARARAVGWRCLAARRPYASAVAGGGGGVCSAGRPLGRWAPHRRRVNPGRIGPKLAPGSAPHRPEIGPGPGAIQGRRGADYYD